MSTKLTTEEFIKRATVTHSNRYDYSVSRYINKRTNISISCNIHGIFEQLPEIHIRQGSGCPDCKAEKIGNFRRGTWDEVLIRANKVHKNKYKYPKQPIFKNNKMKMIIECQIHGNFNQKINNHLLGQGCPSCTKMQYSKQAIRWLMYIEKTEKINIQHAENMGEYKIPTTNYRVDGYCKETNTCYEFHGDVYHGNPSLYSLEHCHPFEKHLTAAELYENTLKKERIIKKLGYNLVIIWESDWKRYCKNNKNLNAY